MLGIIVPKGIGIIVPKGILSYMCIFVPKIGYRYTSNM